VTKLKLGVVESDKPVNVNVRVPASLYRDLEAYAEALAAETQKPKTEIRKLIVPMVEHFLETDRGFSKVRKQRAKSAPNSNA
jgi:hypothetical protein